MAIIKFVHNKLKFFEMKKSIVHIKFLSGLSGLWFIIFSWNTEPEMRFWSPFPVDGWRELLKQFRRLLSLRDNMLGSLYLTVQAMIHKGKYSRYACLSEIRNTTTWLYFLRRGTISFISKKVLAILFSFHVNRCVYILKKYLDILWSRIFFEDAKEQFIPNYLNEIWSSL